MKNVIKRFTQFVNESMGSELKGIQPIRNFGYLSDEFDLHTSGELTAEQAYKRTMNPLGR